MEETLTCQWCGATGSLDDFELDEHNGEGFWCPDCDGFTYYDKTRNHLRRILLILEQKDGGKADPVPKTPLKKRLSPLRYPGGKSKLIDYLAAQFRKESLKTFVEVFAGGASVGLSLLDAGLTEHLVINDTDPGIYAFWVSVVYHPEKLLKRLSGPDPNRAEFRSCQQILDSPKGWSQDDPGVGHAGVQPAWLLRNYQGLCDGWQDWHPRAAALSLEREYTSTADPAHSCTGQSN